MAASNRLYLPAIPRPGEELRLDDERSHYVTRVLRLRAGDEVVLFDGTGGEYIAVLAGASKRNAVVRVGHRRDRNVESPLSIQLIQGVSRGERMDTVVQKATELGVHRITPVITEHSVVQLDADRAANRVQHWARIARSACEQCGRNVVPDIAAPLSFDSWLTNLSDGQARRILLHPGAAVTLMSLQERPGPVQLLIGPEGGLSDGERQQALDAGFSSCSLGARILRTETAAIAAIAILQARWGDLA